MGDNRCEHLQRTPGNARMTNQDSLQHFLHCLNPASQASWWASMRNHYEVGEHCWEADHRGIIERQRAYTLKLLTGIRKVVEEYERVGVVNGPTITAELQELIS